MAQPPSASPQRYSLLLGLGVLAVVLGWLWRESFNPRMLAFANDAPFGLMAAYAEHRWGNFGEGSWSPTVWLGSPALPLQPAFSHGLFLFGGPVVFGKFAAPLAMMLLGLGAYFFCRKQGFVAAVAVLAGLAAAVNLNFLSHASWGLGVRATAAGFTLLALAALSDTSGRAAWIRAVLGGIFTGFAVIEGADSGAILSIFVAAYCVYVGLIDSGSLGSKLIKSGLRLGLVIVCAVWMAALALSSLIGTQIQGVAGMGEDAAQRQARWDFVTGLSFPKLEVVRFAIPGIMGIRSISPGDELYWGNVGADISPPRFNGGSEYAGVLVLIVAGWAVARAASKSGRQPFTERERKLIAFWAAVAVVTLLLAFGHYAPFYQVVFSIPYFSTIRGPMKFLHVTHLAWVILFAYGLQGMVRQYLEPSGVKKTSSNSSLVNWWRSAEGFERSWAYALVGLAAVAVAGALIYASYQPKLVTHLARLGFTGADGQAMAAFSIREVFIFAVTTTVCALLLAWIAAGRLTGSSAKWAMVGLGAILALDLGRAASPFILHFNYQRRYEPNAVTDFLKQKPWEHRVAARPHPTLRSTLSAPNDSAWPALHNQWLENQMPYNEIQTIDIWQMPRRPELDEAYLKAFTPTTNLGLVGRLWDLTNTRYLLGARGVQSEIDKLFGGGQAVFKPVLGFDIGYKGGVAPQAGVTVDDLAAVPNPQGQYAIFENTHALPRTQLFTRWETITNDSESLARLGSPEFKPSASVVVASPLTGITPGSDPASTNSASAEISDWTPKRITIQTKAEAPGVLLLNERWHPDWQVTVDGQPADLLRANFIMRGVAVPAGTHSVVFRYAPPMGMLWVTLSALVVAGALGLGLFWLSRRPALESSKA